MQPAKKRFAQVAWPSYLVLLDAAIEATQVVIEDLLTFNFELKLELAIDKWLETGDFSGLLSFWCENKFTPQISGQN